MTLFTPAWWLLAVLAYGFVARVLTGPAHMVPGRPKRFAQGIGAVVTTAGAVLALGFGATTAAAVLTAVLVVFATLESVFALCVGCKLFALLMRAGLVPELVCEAWGQPPACGHPAPGHYPAPVSAG